MVLDVPTEAGLAGLSSSLYSRDLSYGYLCLHPRLVVVSG